MKTRFVKLTKPSGDEIVRVQSRNIIAIEDDGLPGCGGIVYIGTRAATDIGFLVKETPEQILKLIEEAEAGDEVRKAT